MNNLFVHSRDMEEQIKNLKENSNTTVMGTVSMASTTEEIYTSVSEVVHTAVRQNEEIEKIANSFQDIEKLVEELDKIIQ